MKAILLIDDHIIFAKIFAAYLLRTKFRNSTLQSARDVYSATEHLESKTFDLIVLDNRIPPHFNYVESVKLLISANWQGPILLVSGDNVNVDTDVLENQYIRDFILKDDLNEHTLEQAIVKCLSFPSPK
ncbi:response regulator [Hirschia litorea]|uniref:Response regulator n=1 Tax=Hirschia litorea TaxID=1199156 RepID=A0ABW2INW5_9PROT